MAFGVSLWWEQYITSLLVKAERMTFDLTIWSVAPGVTPWPLRDQGWMRCDDETKQEGRKAARQRGRHGFCPPHDRQVCSVHPMIESDCGGRSVTYYHLRFLLNFTRHLGKIEWRDDEPTQVQLSCFLQGFLQNFFFSGAFNSFLVINIKAKLFSVNL